MLDWGRSAGTQPVTTVAGSVRQRCIKGCGWQGLGTSGPWQAHGRGANSRTGGLLVRALAGIWKGHGRTLKGAAGHSRVNGRGVAGALAEALARAVAGARKGRRRRHLQGHGRNLARLERAQRGTTGEPSEALGVAAGRDTAG